MIKGMKTLSHFRAKFVRIFNYLFLMISIGWNQNNEIIISSINADTVQNKLNYYMEEDYGLTESFVLRSFNIEGNSSIYDVIITSNTIVGF